MTSRATISSRLPAATMRAVILRRFGGPEHLEDGELPTPTPGPDEVRVRLRASSFNAIDCAWRRGELSPVLPAVLGRDFAGVIEAVGSAVDRSRIGEAVMGYTASRTATGTHAQAICIDARLVGRKPQSVSFAAAAALPVVGLTALDCVETRAGLRPQEPVLVTGGRGGVGTMVIRLAQRVGARVMAVATTDAAAEHLRTLLAPRDDVVVRLDPDLDDGARLAAVRRAAGGDVPVAIDAAGGAMKRLCLAAAAPEGRVVSIVEELPGFDNVWDEQTSPITLKGLSFHFVQIGARAAYGSPQGLRAYSRRLGQIARMIDNGTLKPPPMTVVGPLSAATVRTAHERLESRQVFGKLVMTHDDLPDSPGLARA